MYDPWHSRKERCAYFYRGAWISEAASLWEANHYYYCNNQPRAPGCSPVVQDALPAAAATFIWLLIVIFHSLINENNDK